MSGYKRNQVEEAISGVLDPRSPKPTTEVRTRLKRLLETDRALGWSPRSSDPERANYAFYSSDAPGSGVEIRFSGYEAFALLTGLRLMANGWPQSFAVSVMRRVRAKLEQEHARILGMDTKALFDQEKIRQSAKPGDMAFDVTDPVLLTIISKWGARPDQEIEPSACAIARGPSEAMKFWKQAGGTGAATMFELAALAHRLGITLARTPPVRRGRR